MTRDTIEFRGLLGGTSATLKTFRLGPRRIVEDLRQFNFKADRSGTMTAYLDRVPGRYYQFNLEDGRGINFYMYGQLELGLSSPQVRSGFSLTGQLKKYGKALPGTYIEQMSSFPFNNQPSPVVIPNQYLVVIPTLEFAAYMKTALDWAAQIPALQKAREYALAYHKNSVTKIAKAFSDFRFRDVKITPIAATNLYYIEANTSVKNLYLAAANGRGNPVDKTWIAFVHNVNAALGQSSIGKGIKEHPTYWHIGFVVKRGTTVLAYDGEKAKKPFNVIYTVGSATLFPGDPTIGHDPFSSAAKQSPKNPDYYQSSALPFLGTATMLAGASGAFVAATSAAFRAFAAATARAAANIAKQLAKKAGKKGLEMLPSALEVWLLTLYLALDKLGDKLDGKNNPVPPFGTMKSLINPVKGMVDSFIIPNKPRIGISNTDLNTFKSVFGIGKTTNVSPAMTNIFRTSGKNLIASLRSLVSSAFMTAVLIGFGEALNAIVKAAGGKLLNDGRPATYFFAFPVTGSLYPWAGFSPAGTQVTNDSLTISFPIPGFLFPHGITPSGKVKLPVNIYFNYAIKMPNSNDVSAPFKTWRAIGGLEYADNPFAPGLSQKITGFVMNKIQNNFPNFTSSLGNFFRTLARTSVGRNVLTQRFLHKLGC